MIKLTDRAKIKLECALAREGKAGLRIAFAGGCGALGYRLYLAEEPQDGDQIVDLGSVKIFLDSKSASDLVGAEIDVSEAGKDLDFILNHPLAVNVTSC